MIPKVIMQTGKHKSDVNKHSVEWQKVNPMYEYKFFDDVDCRKFIREYFENDVVEAFDTLLPGAFKADLFRYCYLYIHGGVYIDLDCAPILPLAEILLDGYDFISVSERRQIPGVYQAFIACVPNVKFLRIAINKIVENCKKNYYPKIQGRNDWESILSITGPVLLCKSMNNVHESGAHEIDNVKVFLYILGDSHILDMYDKKLIVSKVDDFQSSDSYQNMFLNRKIYKQPKEPKEATCGINIFNIVITCIILVIICSITLYHSQRKSVK